MQASKQEPCRDRRILCCSRAGAASAAASLGKHGIGLLHRSLQGPSPARAYWQLEGRPHRPLPPASMRTKGRPVGGQAGRTSRRPALVTPAAPGGLSSGRHGACRRSEARGTLLRPRRAPPLAAPGRRHATLRRVHTGLVLVGLNRRPRLQANASTAESRRNQAGFLQPPVADLAEACHSNCSVQIAQNCSCCEPGQWLEVPWRQSRAGVQSAGTAADALSAKDASPKLEAPCAGCAAGSCAAGTKSSGISIRSRAVSQTGDNSSHAAYTRSTQSRTCWRIDRQCRSFR